MSIKVFCDIADLSIIKKFNKKKLVKGFTTNPSLIRKAGARNYKSYSKNILLEDSIKAQYSVYNNKINNLESYVISRGKFNNNKSIQTEIFGKIIPNPIGIAAGFDKDAEVYNPLFKLGFGFVGQESPLVIEDLENFELGDFMTKKILNDLTDLNLE